MLLREKRKCESVRHCDGHEHHTMAHIAHCQCVNAISIRYSHHDWTSSMEIAKAAAVLEKRRAGSEMGKVKDK